MKKIEFTVFHEPIAQPRQRHSAFVSKVGRVIQKNYVPGDHPVHRFKSCVRAAATAKMFSKPLDCPLVMDVVFVMPRPQNKFWKTKAMPRYPHVGVPDRDNLVKSLQDAMNGIVYRDDSLIYDGRITKWVANGDEKPHVEVTISYEDGSNFAVGSLFPSED